MLWNALQATGLRGIRGVWCHEAGYSRALTVVSMQPAYKGHAVQTGFVASQLPEGAFGGKYVVVVDDDIDVFNLSDVMWAVITRTHADRDITFIHGAMGAILDPTSDPENHTVTKVGIDATKPGGRDFAERLTITDEQRARVRGILERAGIRL